MAITYVNSAETHTTASVVASLSLAQSALGTITNGNLLIAFVETNINPTSGFAITGGGAGTSWVKLPNAEHYGTNVGMCAWYKYANNETGSTYTASWTQSCASAFQILQYSGTTTSSPIDTDSWGEITTSAGVYTTNSVNSTVNNDLVLSLHHEKVTLGSYTWTPHPKNFLIN